MSRAYKFHDPEGTYFVTFATVEWVDVFTRREYKDILVESLRYCQKEKELAIHAWVIMSNHVHLIISKQGDVALSAIMRDLKKYTAQSSLKILETSATESRRDWMLEVFRKAGSTNSNNRKYQFWRQDNKPILLDSAHMVDQKLEYLHMNPVVEGLVDDPADYLYSSAFSKGGMKGLLELAAL